MKDHVIALFHWKRQCIKVTPAQSVCIVIMGISTCSVAENWKYIFMIGLYQLENLIYTVETALNEIAIRTCVVDDVTHVVISTSPSLVYTAMSNLNALSGSRCVAVSHFT